MVFQDMSGKTKGEKLNPGSDQGLNDARRVRSTAICLRCKQRIIVTFNLSNKVKFDEDKDTSLNYNVL